MVTDIQEIPEGSVLKTSPGNPFAVTKAVDFSDEEIQDLWVDLSDDGGLLDLARPSTPMPMLIVGGKGSGKTHLMRYLSASAQHIRAQDGGFAYAVRNDGYVGIYIRLSGLNASRFSGKQQADEKWRDVFAYYMELWLGQHVLRTAEDFLADIAQASRTSLLSRLTAQFTTPEAPQLNSLNELAAHLAKLQQRVDHAVNNCSLTGTLEIEIELNRGAMIFGCPKAISEDVPSLRDTTFLYLLDEFENLGANQQRYVNTLIREKEAPASFRVGARSYGVRTYSTLSADEELREGSEYERLALDHRLRAYGPRYNEFLRNMVARRLENALRFNEEFPPLTESIDDFFDRYDRDAFFSSETQFVIEKYSNRERPYLRKLRGKLEHAAASGAAPGLTSADDVPPILKRLSLREFPLLEKVSTFLLYRAWSKQRDLREASFEIARQAEEYLNGGTASEYRKATEKFGLDMLAQLLRECDQRQRYWGLDTFIRMSAGLPRNLLVILKHVYSWAEFLGEKPFSSKRISIRAQQQGVLDAAHWFFADARIPGERGTQTRLAIERIATFFREIRFSDKPSECSLATFSTCRDDLSDGARTVLDLACDWSLLLEVIGGQKDKNSMRVDQKYQLNPMLAPLWQLPTARRGAIALNAREASTILAPANEAEFFELLRSRLSRMTAPFSRRVRHAQTGLFDPDDD